MAKVNVDEVKSVPREVIAGVNNEADFVEFLRRQLDWPIPINVERMADVAIPHDVQKDFGFKAGEDRIQVSRLLNLTEDQPWGVFLFEFKTDRPYLSHLRRLLRVLGSQRTLRKGDPIWKRTDILFICTHDWQEYQFVHFAGEKPESAVISTFGWKGPDDPFLHTLCKHNLPRLRMPAPLASGGYAGESWRTQWIDAFNIKPVTDEFYATLKEVFDAVQAGVKGIKGEDRRFFAELVVNRMVFLKFVEKKGWLNGDRDYLYNRFKAHGRLNYWRNFLCDFFFEALCKEKDQRTKKVNELLGDVPFLNAELFAPSDKWDDWEVQVDNRVFDLLFEKLLNPYNFTVCETSPLDVEIAFNQDLLGYGYEELIADQHGQGAYYTLPTEVNLMCRESLRAYLEAKCTSVDKELIGKFVYGELTTADRVSEKDALALFCALHDVTVVDPALGSGTFPVAMMKHLFTLLRMLGGFLQNATEFKKMLKSDGFTDPGDAFALKLHIIERSIYGCDIDYFAVQIAKLRFWIELMVHCDKPEALPNFNCKLVVGDALVSVIGTDNKGNLITLEHLLGHPTKDKSLLAQKQVDQLATLKGEYFTVRDTKKRKQLEDKIEQVRADLLRQLGVQTDKIRRTNKHVLWQIDFAEIFAGKDPGFHITIGNPPYLRHELIDAALANCGLSVDQNTLQSIYAHLIGVEPSGQSDLYVYFFLRSLSLLKRQDGVLCFICSNSWLDVDYGGYLQCYVATSTTVRAIVDNKYKRSFASADINTAITLFTTRVKLQADQQACATFVSYRRPFDEGGALPLPTPNEGTSVIETPIRRCFVIPQNVLVTESQSEPTHNGKWGARYLRAPSVYFKLLKKAGQEVVNLSAIADVGTYLNTGGADGFFFLKTIKWNNDNVAVETSDGAERFNLPVEFLRPVIRSPRECDQILVTTGHIGWCIFVCDLTAREVPAEVRRFIQWGESEGFHERSGCRNRSPWYRLAGQAKKGAPILIGRNHDRTHIIYYNPKRIISNRFYRIEPLRGYPVGGLVAYLNSTIGWLQKELLGRTNLGQGALDTQGTDLARILVPNRELGDAIAKTTDDVFLTLSKRKALPVMEELKQADRIELDRRILATLGCPEYVSELSDAVSDLVSARLLRARS